MEQEIFFSALVAELKCRAKRVKETEASDPWDEVNEQFTMQGGIANYRAGYGDMGDLCMVI